MVSVSLNQIAAPALDVGDFITLSRSIGCVGIELRMDVAADRISMETAPKICELARNNNQRILALSEISAFDDWNDDKRNQALSLIGLAKAIGAEAVSFIPRNDWPRNDGPRNDGPRNDELSENTSNRIDKLSAILAEIQPLLADADLIGLIEPLGFKTASYQLKADIAAAIEQSGSAGQFKIIHDTFHHALSEEDSVFAQMTGLVHISGVEDADLSFAEMRDENRVLVGSQDRLGNIEQITELQKAGYSGPVSFEPFSPKVQNATNLKAELESSIHFIENRLQLCAA